MTSDTLPIEAIRLDDHIREDLGNIDQLADSIDQCGLIAPIVVDAGDVLIDGRRRLEAVRRLRWSEVPVRRYDDLTDAERLAVEIEANERRKDFTTLERSKMIARLATMAADVATEAATKELRAESTRNGPGRPARPGSLRDLERRLGIDEATIRTARNHVHAADRYPELRHLPQYRVFALADALDLLPDDGAREPFLTRIRESGENGWSTYSVQDAILQDVRQRKLSAKAARKLERAEKRLVKRATGTDKAILLPDAPADAALMPATDPATATLLPQRPSKTPEEQEREASWELRRKYLASERAMWDILAIRPRPILAVLEPSDKPGARDFIAKLLPWCLDFADRLNISPDGWEVRRIE